MTKTLWLRGMDQDVWKRISTYLFVEREAEKPAMTDECGSSRAFYQTSVGRLVHFTRLVWVVSCILPD